MSIPHSILEILLRVQSAAALPVCAFSLLRRAIPLSDDKRGYIFGQGELKGQKLYCAKANLTACEAVSVYNAMIWAGRSASYGQVRREFLRRGALTLFFLGFFGGNPYSIGRVLKALGMGYEKVTPEQMTADGGYIISFWNGRKDLSLHTVFCVMEHGRLVGYNVYSNDRHPRPLDLKEYGGLFIRGYYLGGSGPIDGDSVN